MIGIDSTRPQSLDARQKAPGSIKEIYKYFQKLSLDVIQEDSKLLDFRRGLSNDQIKLCREVGKVLGENVRSACLCSQLHDKHLLGLFPDVPVFEHQHAPGEPIHSI